LLIIAQYGAFDANAMGANDEEDAAAAEDVAADVDALGDVIRDAKRECESEKEKGKFKRMLEDHRKLLYQTTERWAKKGGYNTRTVAMEGKEWYFQQDIWAVIEDHKKDAFESKRIAHHYI